MTSKLTREPITHKLKIYPEFFSAVCTGVKRAELRKNDRDYRVGDTLHLMETPRGSCHRTGEFINVKITHIADVGEWMPGYVLLSVELQELRKAAMDSEPVAWRWRRGPDTRWHLASRGDLAGEVEPLYRHAQQPTVTGNRLSSALSLTQMQIDWICNTCATIYHTANDDVAQGYIDEIRATLERMKSIDTAQQPVVPDELNTRTANDVMNEHLGWKDYGDAEVFCIAWNACRAAMLQAGNSPAIPDGYVMVPKEPTEEMLAAAKEWTGLTSTAEVVYIKMLAAAQQEVKGE